MVRQQLIMAVQMLGGKLALVAAGGLLELLAARVAPVTEALAGVAEDMVEVAGMADVGFLALPVATVRVPALREPAQ
jgi:hypothetical protein